MLTIRTKKKVEYDPEILPKNIAERFNETWK